ncbi:MAG: DUF2341 domain-containing protein [Polyangiaceae bacterium]|nr:DUF2341 domain-containing protein [Polyangiaceae bacterium]
MPTTAGRGTIDVSPTRAMPAGGMGGRGASFLSGGASAAKAGSAPAPPAGAAGASSVVSTLTRRWVQLAVPSLSEALTGLPVLLRIQTSLLRGATDGAGLRFFSAEGEALPYEVELWAAGGEALIWVRAPELRPNGNGYGFWLYYGGQDSPPSTFSASDVWAPSYSAVWHMADKVADSSGHQQSEGAANMGSFAASKIGAGLFLKRLEKDFVKLPEYADFVSGASGVTVSAWVKHDRSLEPTLQKGQQILFATSIAEPSHISRVSVAVSSAGELIGEANPDDGPYEWALSPRDSVADREWSYVTVVIDVPRKTTRLYVNGDSVGERQGMWTGSLFLSTPSGENAIGSEEGGVDSWFNGMIDELRVDKVARSSEWVRLQALAAGCAPQFASLSPAQDVLGYALP